MALSEKIEISLPEQEPLFLTQYQIGYQDINFANHLSNEKYLVLCEEAYQRYLKFLDSSAPLGYFWGLNSVIASAKIQFIGSGFYGDNLEIKLWITEHSNSAFRVVVQLQLEGGGRELVRIQVDRIFVDVEQQKIVPCPEAFIKSLTNVES